MTNPPIISIPIKKTFEVNLSKPIRAFIQATYGVEKDDYSFAAEALNQLRTSALLTSTRQDRLNQLMRYYDQLVAIKTKLPISENQIRVSFKWQDALDRGKMLGGKRTLCLSKAGYEQSCVLFNIAAWCSELAVGQPLDQDEGLRQAVKYLQISSGAFEFLRDNILSSAGTDLTADLYPQVCAFLAIIMIAQANELTLGKGVKDSLKPTLIAKLANQIAAYYNEAYTLSQTEHNKDVFGRQFSSVINSKQYFYTALAEYYQAQSEEKRVSVSICRYQRAVELLETAKNKLGGTFGSLNPAQMQMAECVKSSIERIRRSLEAAKKDNDFVYHERIPNYKNLDSIGKIAICAPKPISFPVSESFSDLFASLIPLEVNNALLAFSSKRADFANQEINRIRGANELLGALMNTLNLPAEVEDVLNSDHDAQSSNIPQSIVSKSSKIKQMGGAQWLDQKIQELPLLLKRNKEILDEAIRLLDEEESCDSELRSRLSSNWKRTPSQQLTVPLREEARKYREVIELAVNADRVVKEKYSKNRDYIVMLSKPLNELERQIPPATLESALKNNLTVKELKRLCDEVEVLKSDRLGLEARLKEQGDSVQADFVNSFRGSSSVDQNALIAEKIDSVFRPLRQQVSDSLALQERLVDKIQRAHMDLSREKSGSGPGPKMRSEFLSNLALGFDAFCELSHNLNEGCKFYNDLTPLLVKFQSKISDFCFARKTEKDELFRDIQQGIVSSGREGDDRRDGTSISQTPVVQMPPYPTTAYSQTCPHPPPALPVGYNPYTYYGLNIPYPTQQNQQYPPK